MGQAAAQPARRAEDDAQVVLGAQPAGRATALAAHHGLVKQLAFSADGQYIVSRSGLKAEILVWGVAAGDVLATVPMPATGGRRNHCSAVAASPTQPVLAVTGSSDGTVCLWDMAAGAVVWQQPAGDRNARRVAFAPNGQAVVAAQRDTGVTVWDAGSGAQLCHVPARARGAVLTGDSAWLLLITRDLRQLQLWRTVPSVACAASIMLANPLDDLCLSPDGRWLATPQASNPKSQAPGAHDLLVWALDAPAWAQMPPAGPAVALVGHDGMISDCCWASDTLLLSVSQDTTARLWALPDGACVWLWAGRQRSACAASPANLALTFAIGQIELLRICCLEPRVARHPQVGRKEGRKEGRKKRREREEERGEINHEADFLLVSCSSSSPSLFFQIKQKSFWRGS